MNKKNIITSYLQSSNWLGKLQCRSIADVSFLAAGEYNENWVISATTEKSNFQRKYFVFRINHGSQLALGKKQIEYEFNVLSALKKSIVTPVPYFYDSEAGNFDPVFDHGVLLMEFLQGTPLDYTQDLEHAAKIFAAIHTQHVPEQNEFIYQRNPVNDIVSESLGLLARFNDHPKKVIRHKLEAYSNELRKLGEQYAPVFAAEPQVIVNTEVNSGNFIINREDNSAYLVDWEKAVVSSRYQDLGHFIVPTTTLWKTDFIATPEYRTEFLSRYKKHAGLDTPIEELAILTGILEKTITLRGLSWCYMAWYEYTQQDRALKNNDTFRTIERYLDNFEWFLQ